MKRHATREIVYAAALGRPGVAGYQAAVVVTCAVSTGREHEEVFRDEALDGGKVWVSPDEALAFALDAGKAAAHTHDAFGTFSLTGTQPNLG
jgi:hypothetical protein